jgi:photosystem II stability/assembly factor-like uncharacterized protein
MNHRKNLMTIALVATLVVSMMAVAIAQEDGKLNARTLAGVKFRNIGPALMSGRIADVKIHPTDRSTWYVAVASGGVWKTTNAGSTWTPIFDHYGSFSIGCVTIDPNNPEVIWVGTGEDKSQRSVGLGDGVYKSLDGGRSFKNMGLKTSEHIARIIIDPRDSNVVWVASQGPLWSNGGERGLYKSVDGGVTWTLSLEISKYTGVTDLVLDPCNPDTMYAASYQRRRHEFTLINGGPESAVYKSTDAGENWRKLTSGLPRNDVGKIALAVSPQKPNVVYADVEAEGRDGGFFRSDNYGESFTKMSSYVSMYPMYYQEIYADPHRFDHIYSVDTRNMFSEDGGKTFKPLGEANKHGDNHAFAFLPDDPDYMIVGSDGGLYESWDRGKTYRFHANLPITQYYRVELDNSLPFYNVLGGTQDNSSQSGPSRTIRPSGISNEDWFITVGGDGFQTRVDPTDPNTLYAESQYGVLSRYDRASGESIGIQPQPGKGEDANRFNWDAPLIISPHSNTRLYFASQRVYMSEDRGNSWTDMGGDLTQAIDRNKLKVMDRVWSVDSVEKNEHTTQYGNVSALIESELEEGLVIAGTDDGLIRVYDKASKTWAKYDSFPGVPDNTYVSDVFASPHNVDTIYATFNNHKMGDYNAYVVKSTDRGKTWKNISSNVPAPNYTWTVYEDHKRQGMLYLGTEYGLFLSYDDGGSWMQLKAGLPVIPIMDIEIQKRENDLALASFGRGYFILDDLTPLQMASEETFAKDAFIFPVKKALQFTMTGGRGGSQGADFYTADNPPYGAVFSYYLNKSPMTRNQTRKMNEKSLQRKGEDTFYPSWDELKAEDREESPSLIFTIADAAGNVVRRIATYPRPGINRIAWDLSYPSTMPASSGGGGYRRFFSGAAVVPGNYSVKMGLRSDGKYADLTEPVNFVVESLNLATLGATDKQAVLDFQNKLGEIVRVVMGVNAVAADAQNSLSAIIGSVDNAIGADFALADKARALKTRLTDAMELINGDPTVPSRATAYPPSVMSRLQSSLYGTMRNTSAPTQTFIDNYEIAKEGFGEAYGLIKQIVEVDLVKLEAELEAAKAPYTPGRALPKWNK